MADPINRLAMFSAPVAEPVNHLAQAGLPPGHPSNMLMGLRDMIPQVQADDSSLASGIISRIGRTLTGMPRAGLETMANWLEGTHNPDAVRIGPDTIAPLGLAGFAMGVPRAAVGAKAAAMADNAKSSTPGTVVNSMGEQPQTIRAYHGSPHDFDKFDMGKIGTGEGSQAFGHGLYFAENPKTADAYRPSRGLNPFKARPGKSYEVSIKGAPDEFIDLNAPLSAQSKSIQAAFETALDQGLKDQMYSPGMASGVRADLSNAATAEDAMRLLRDVVGDQRASEVLKEGGVKGTRFLDSVSRDRGQGTRNYVVFDDSLVDINRKYASPASSAPGLAANSTQQEDDGVLSILRRYGLLD